MAKHKKKRTKKVSKGLRPSISNTTLKLAKSGYDIMNKLNAWRRGKKGFIIIANPNTEETNKRFIRVSYERFFGGTYKDIKARVKRTNDNNKVEIAL